MNEEIVRKILVKVWKERDRQDKLKAEGKFKYTCADGGMTHAERYVVLGEEFGEVGRALLNWHGFATDYLETGETKDERMNKIFGDLKEELIQVAAVSVAWLERLEQTTVETGRRT